jgi:DNA-binding transcriptional LysR family regulator
MIKMTVLDVDAVRTFVLVADLQSFTRAAEALDSSQAVISARLKRLEERLGHRLIERTPRSVRLSARGAAFLDSARAFIAAHERAVTGLVEAPQRLVLGISDHVAGADLPVLLARLHSHDPGLLMEVQIGASRDLLETFDRGMLDAALVRREDDRRDGEMLAEEQHGWFAAPHFEHRAGETLRLASTSTSCFVRNSATRALDIAGIGWAEVFVGGGVAAVAAAITAGLAVAALAQRVAPAGAIDVAKCFGLPALPASEVVLHSTLTDARSRGALRILASAFREHRPPANHHGTAG